jgi:hypothetical protein
MKLTNRFGIPGNFCQCFEEAHLFQGGRPSVSHPVDQQPKIVALTKKFEQSLNRMWQTCLVNLWLGHPQHFGARQGRKPPCRGAYPLHG